MAPTRKNDGLLARVNFPLYAVEMLTSRHVVVAGGGGSSKTGVANGFEIYEIYHNGTHFVAEEVVRHETGPSCVMNFALKNDGRRSYLVAGQESHCQMYYVNPTIYLEGELDDEVTRSGDILINNRRYSTQLQNGSVRRRHNSQSTSGLEEVKDNNNVKQNKKLELKNGLLESKMKKIHFDIKTGDSIQTDFLLQEPLQRIVRISANGKLMVTGGTDGHIRLWSFPQMSLQNQIMAHKKEIDDIDISPDSKYIVTIGKDGEGLVWEVSTNKLKYKLEWQKPEGVKYLFKRCRYGTIESSKTKYRLYTITNPFGKVGKQRGYLQQWNCDVGNLNKSVAIEESLASLAVRDDGRFIAIGTMFSGSVSIYIAFSLQRVLHIPNAHSMFVTGLEFLPITNAEGPPISSDTEAAVLSISVDNKVCIHSLHYRKTLPAWVAMIFIVMVLILSFLFCSYLGI